MARTLALEAGCSAFIVDPVSVDELTEPAKMTGVPGIEKLSLSHALSVGAATRAAAAELGMAVDELNLVVLHLGSGFTVSAKKNGRQVDCESLGMMAPIRSGALPMFELVDFCFGGKWSREEIRRLIIGKGGWTALLGEHDLRKVYDRIDAGDTFARLVLDATLYGLAKQTAAMVAALGGHPDAIVVTGGLSLSERFIEELKQRISWLSGRIIVYPGSDEMKAMAQGALRVLNGEEEAQSMTPFLDWAAK
jgi:butyrate kinase